jgi:PIN domain nuclease of toxin-antitoxin system
MIAVIANTHAIIWYLSDDPRLSKNAAEAFERAGSHGEEVGVPTICLVEMIYLVEKKRIPDGVY